MKTLSCLKNFGSFACLLVSSGVSIWTWHYVTSPKTVGEIYEREGKALKTVGEIINSRIPEYKVNDSITIKKHSFVGSCHFLSSSSPNLGEYERFFIEVCSKEIPLQK